MFKKIITMILLVVCLAGCGTYGSKANKGNKDEYSPIGYPNVTEYGTGNYHYVVDNNTGVDICVSVLDTMLLYPSCLTKTATLLLSIN